MNDMVTKQRSVRFVDDEIMQHCISVATWSPVVTSGEHPLDVTGVVVLFED